MDKIWLSSPHMGGKERQFMLEAFDSNWIAPLGPFVNKFEQELSARLNGFEVAALSSGTSALHLALILLGVKSNDFVLCQSFTFSASSNPILYQGAIPVFVDSETETWNMDPELLEQAIISCKRAGNTPKAIIIVHLYGMPARIMELKAIAEKYGIPIIEDAAEALGSSIKNTPCGCFGDFGVLSFNGNKIITTSGGGALVSSNKELIERSRFLATQARDPAPHYEHSVIGYNYRLSNICAAIGCGQVESLSDKIAKRRHNFAYYKKKLSHLSFIKFLEEPDGYFSNRWLTTFYIDHKEAPCIDLAQKIRLSLDQSNIESRPLWKPMHLQPVFKNYQAYVSGVSQYLFENGLCIPSGSNLSEADLDRVVNIIRTTHL